MPTEARGDISSVKPTGWHQNEYSFVGGRYLYNRCHLIAFSLADENANEKNLITGTRYLNEAMIPFEDMVHDFIKEQNIHVMYRVTPVFLGNNLLAEGVLMEAYSVEDNGATVEFCVWCYNVQPGVHIDYSTGENRADGTVPVSEPTTAAPVPVTEITTSAPVVTTSTYVLNTNTYKFHRPTCSSVARMSAKNKYVYTGDRATVISWGYEACKVCKP